MAITELRIALAVVLVMSGLSTSGQADELPKAQAEPPRFIDRFKSEPVRPKVNEPIRFLDSYEQARAEAKATNRRIFVYFTGPGCAWCRVLESRTFNDAEVVDLSRKYACVELHTDRDTKLADEFQIDSIPRSIVLTPDGAVLDQRVGYIAATDYAAWLKAGAVRVPGHGADRAEKRVPPAPVGAPEDGADLVVWFIDNDRVAAGWGEPDAFRHPMLLGLLGAWGLKARVEHLSRADFPGRWQQAEPLHRLPDLIAATNWAGTVRDLEKDGRLRSVLSERLTFMTENASCQDFLHRFLWMVKGSGHESNACKAIGPILSPGPELEMPGRTLPMDAGRDEAEGTARRAVVAYLSGDPARLKSVAARRSSQLAECKRPAKWIKDMRAKVGAVELRGNEWLAVGIVEATFESDRFLGTDPVAVVLVREDGRWKALVVSRDVVNVKNVVSRLCPLLDKLRPTNSQPPEPRLLAPLDGQTMSETLRELSWTVPAGGEPLMAQICEVRMGDANEPESSWPDVRLSVFPAEPRNGKLNPFLGVMGSNMSWGVWTIGQSGRVAVSPLAHFKVQPVRVK
jgi:thioredoxin-related protein